MEKLRAREEGQNAAASIKLTMPAISVAMIPPPVSIIVRWRPSNWPSVLSSPERRDRTGPPGGGPVQVHRERATGTAAGWDKARSPSLAGARGGFRRAVHTAHGG